MTEHSPPSRRATARSPRHVAVIMDGNGRWATERGSAAHGGARGRRRLRARDRAGLRRARGRGAHVVQLLDRELGPPRGRGRRADGAARAVPRRRARGAHENRVRLRGDRRARPAAPARRARCSTSATALTAGNDGLQLTLALSYGSRAEIVDAVRRIASDVAAGRLAPAPSTSDRHRRRLYTAGTPDPDLLIRTSGEMRLSNFLLWQLAYAELYVTDVYWPDFRRPHLEVALERLRAAAAAVRQDRSARSAARLTHPRSSPRSSACACSSPAIICGAVRIAVEMHRCRSRAVVALDEYARMAFPDDRLAELRLDVGSRAGYLTTLYLGDAWWESSRSSPCCAHDVRDHPAGGDAGRRRTNASDGCSGGGDGSAAASRSWRCCAASTTGSAWVFLLLGIAWFATPAASSPGRFFGNRKLYERRQPEEDLGRLLRRGRCATIGVVVIARIGLPDLTLLDAGAHRSVHVERERRRRFCPSPC